MKKKTALLFLALLCLQLNLFAQKSTIDFDRVEPPFWWVGMNNSTVELMFYGENIQDYQVLQGDYSNVVILSIEKPENPNYIFVELDISPNANPGFVPIIFSRNGENLNYFYQIKERKNSPDRIQGLSSSDVIYLLFPDRFSNGDASNDEIDGMLEGSNREKLSGRHGGDIQGVINHLDYLKDLGITAIWFNPMVENDQPHESYHGYAVTDHYNIDERFGGNEKYMELVEKCHKNGIKIIKDVVHNHIGDKHWFFQDLPSSDWVHQFEEFTKTTYRAPTLMDPYASEYDRSLMINGWFDTHMPDLNQDNPHVAKFLIQNNIWWIEHFGVDAFRVDTYAYPSPEFTASWNTAILEEYPNFSIFGETWVHGPAVQSFFTRNDNFDNGSISTLPAVTDFQMYYAINEALNKKMGWTEGVSRIYFTLAQDFLYSDPFKNILFLDNHDVYRFYESIGRDYKKYKMGIGLLLTMRGTPSIYYGTEILMFNQSADHGHLRNDFPGGWAEDEITKFDKSGRSAEEQSAFEYIQTLIQYRHKTKVLQTGKLMQFVPENGVYTYFRYDNQSTVMVVMNTDENSTTLNTKRFGERLYGFSNATNVITGDKINDLSQLKLQGQEILILELGR